jgi:predicted transposase YbfD/YdcC
MKAGHLFEHFSIIKDPRQSWKIEHKLFDILLLTICAVIAGADGWEDIEEFGNERLDWLKQYGDFENGIPVHDTIARVISQINPKQFQTCFIQWMASCHESTAGDVIAVDGKTVRRSFDKSKKQGAIHMVSAFSTANKVVLGQLKTNVKSNEITAIPELLKLLEIKGCIVTIDAMGCQKDIAKTIVEQDADYLLAVKGNQGKLEAAFDKHFPLSSLSDYQGDYYNTEEKGHGRNEQRLHLVSDVFGDFVDLSFEWPHLKTLGVAISFRQEGDNIRDKTMSVRYYISSAKLTAKAFAEAIRAHWQIEAQLHWKLDVGMREDECRIRRGDAAENLAGFRHVAMNLLTNEKTVKAGIKRKRLKAALSADYLSRVLAGQGLS